MENSNQFLSPTNGSTLAQLSPLGFGPGIQSWYNEWIQPDPTRAVRERRADAGPPRPRGGLRRTACPRPQNGPTDFQTIGAVQRQRRPVPPRARLADLLRRPAADPGQRPRRTPTSTPRSSCRTATAASPCSSATTAATTPSTSPPAPTFTQTSWGDGRRPASTRCCPTASASPRTAPSTRASRTTARCGSRRAASRTRSTAATASSRWSSPKNSNYAFEEMPDAGVTVTTDGGVRLDGRRPAGRQRRPSTRRWSWTRRTPTTSSPPASRSSRRRTGPTTPRRRTPPADTDWKTVFRPRASRRRPGRQPGLGRSPSTARTSTPGSAAAATVVSGRQVLQRHRHQRRRQEEAEAGDEDGWHKVKAKGLPERFISTSRSTRATNEDDLRDARRLRPAPLRAGRRPRATRASPSAAATSTSPPTAARASTTSPAT